MTTATDLSIEGVYVEYPMPGGSSVRALDGVDLNVTHSEYVVVVGANGAGKSTLVNLVAGTVQPSVGSVTIGGANVFEMSFQERSRVVARVFQDPNLGVFGELTIVDNLLIGMMKGRPKSPFRRARNKSRRIRATELLAEYGRGLEARLDQPANTLSGGQRQLVALTMAIANPPKVLLLDEHTSALDPDIGAAVMERTDDLVRQHGLTTVMVTHNMRQAAKYGDRLIIMSRGKIVDEVSGDEKRQLGEDGLVDRFRSALAGEVTDRMLGS